MRSCYVQSLHTLYKRYEHPSCGIFAPQPAQAEQCKRSYHAGRGNFKTHAQKGLSLIELTIVLLILMALAGLILPSFTEVPAYAQCTATKTTMKAIRDALLGNISGVGYVDDMGSFPDTALTKMLVQDFCDTDPDPTVTESACTGTWVKQEKFNPVTGMGWREPYISETATIKIAADLDASFLSATATPAYVKDDIVNNAAVVFDSFSKGTGVRNPIIIQIPPVPATTPPTPLDKFVRLVSAGQDGILQTDISVHPVPSTGRGDDLILYLKISDPIAIAPKDDQTGCALTDD